MAISYLNSSCVMISFAKQFKWHTGQAEQILNHISNESHTFSLMIKTSKQFFTEEIILFFWLLFFFSIWSVSVGLSYGFLTHSQNFTVHHKFNVHQLIWYDFTNMENVIKTLHNIVFALLIGKQLKSSTRLEIQFVERHKIFE